MSDDAKGPAGRPLRLEDLDLEALKPERRVDEAYRRAQRAIGLPDHVRRYPEGGSAMSRLAHDAAAARNLGAYARTFDLAGEAIRAARPFHELAEQALAASRPLSAQLDGAVLGRSRAADAFLEAGRRLADGPGEAIRRMKDQISGIGAATDGAGVFARILDEQREQQRRIAEAIGSAASLPTFARQVESWRAVTSDLADAVRAAESARLGTPFARDTAAASFAWSGFTAAAVDAAAASRLLDRRPDVIARLLEPARAYTEFFERTRRLLDTAADDRTVLGLRTSLSLATTQMRVVSGLMPDVVPPPDRMRLPRLGRYDAFERERDEILEEVREGEDQSGEELVASSPTAGALALATDLVMIALECNELASVVGRGEIFKLSTRSGLSLVHLTTSVPTDRHSFADFVDALYFVFYESAGTAKLRYLKEHGGPLEAEDPVLNFVWAIKHFRNVLTRHDVDRGSEGEIRKKWKGLRADLDWLGLTTLPRTGAEYREVHRVLLERGLLFVRAISDGLAKGD